MNSFNKQEVDEVAYLADKYRNRALKKHLNKPEAIQYYASRALSTACIVVTGIKGIPFEELTLGIYYYCQDAAFRPIAKEYDAQLELAGANPEKFILGLHNFYNEISKKIKREGMISQFIAFMSACEELSHVTTSDFINKEMADAYCNLVLQTTDYLRPNQYNLRSALIGVTTDGLPMEGEQYLPYADAPAVSLQYRKVKGERFSIEEEYFYMLNAYKKQGVDLGDPVSIFKFEQIQKVSDTTRMALISYINEYTADILPQMEITELRAPFVHMRMDESITERIPEALKARKRTLPANGVKVLFDDPLGEVSELLLKEMVKDNEVILLYRLTSKRGDYSGYYNTNSEFLFSVLINTKAPEVYTCAKALITYCYARFTTDAFNFEENVFWQEDEPFGIKIFGIGGKLKNVYKPSGLIEGKSRAGNPDYDTKSAMVNGYIRKLPIGQTASEQAVELARSMGYSLDPDETYVRPFCKSVFVKVTPDFSPPKET